MAEQEKGGAVLAKGMVLLLAMLGIFGTLSYFFYEQGFNWKGLSLFALIFIVFGLMVRSTKAFFGKYGGRLIFGIWLTAILGGYFVYLISAKNPDTGRRENHYPMGIDLAGGTELIYVLNYDQTDRALERLEDSIRKETDSAKITSLRKDAETMAEAKKTAPDKAAEVVRRRVDPTGTKGIPVTTLGSNKERLRIQLPKATPEEVARIKNAIATQGRLGFHIEVEDQAIVEEIKNSTTTPKMSKTGLFEQKMIRKKRELSNKPNDFSESPIYVKRFPDMDGSRVSLAVARASNEGAGYEIGVKFDAAGSAEFGKLTEKNVRKRMAIVLDGVAHSNPTINEPIYGECRISGSFTKKQAEELASVLTAGSLPAEVRLESEFSVGPSLGQEQIQAGFRATIIATIVVIGFMLIYYRTMGAIAAFCTILNILMLMGAMGFFKATLTLPGIAGIVLTLGMAVDCNVLLLERLREELQRGRSLKLAVTHGFDRAFLTIIDCHLTTLISAIVLYYLGTGPVRGFAVSLSLGVLTTLLINLWFNWVLTEWLVSRDAIKELKMAHWFRTTNFDFMAVRKPWIMGTATLTVISLLSFVIFSGRIYDVDFTGGTLIQFNFAQGKGKDVDSVKKTIKQDIVKRTEERVNKTVAELAVIAKMPVSASAVAGGETRSTLSQAQHEALAKLPKGDVIAAEAEGKKGGLAEVIANIETEKKKLSEVEMVVQAFGQREGGGKSRSFTLTAQLIEPVITDALDRELRATFQADLEPESIVADDKAISIRFPSVVPLQRIEEELKKAVNDMASDPTNLDIKTAIEGLKVVPNAPPQEGYQVAQLTSVPTDPAVREKVLNAVKTVKIPDRIEGPISRTHSFGSQVASDMKWQALFALIVANLAVFVYLWFRFEFSGAWGFGAIAALIHDVTIAAGAVVIAHLLGFPILINLNIVAALLTIIGFSVNDTIVVFDRIREVKAAHPTRSYEEIVNEAVNATMGRTILTMLTVLLADLCLLIFGGPTIQDMAFTLLIGFLVGAYSSIFVASPLMIWWYRRFGGGKTPAASASSSSGRSARGDTGTVAAQV